MHGITGKMNKAETIFQAGDSTGFGIRLGVKYRDPKTKEDTWTNYSAVIFAKAPGQIQFYQSALVEGAIVEVSAEQLKINSFDGKNGQVLSIDMLNARLGYVHNPQGQAQQQQALQRQQPPQQQPAQGYHQPQAPQQGYNQPVPQQPAPSFNQQHGQQQETPFDDGIPF